jgi:signal peptidase II
MPVLLLTAVLSGLVSWVSGLGAEHIREPVHVLGSFATLRLSHNPGIAFSIMLPGGVQSALIGLALLAVCIVAVRSAAKDRTARLAFGMIIGGAVANLVDRLPDGLVTDFFSIGTFPVFNVADSFICIGAGLLVLESLFSKRKQQ